jgi:hypothetical protein
MRYMQKVRRSFAVFIVLIGIAGALYAQSDLNKAVAPPSPDIQTTEVTGGEASVALEKLAVKGRAPKTDYSRSQFGDGWDAEGGCDMRNIVLRRDLSDVTTNSKCQVTSGVLNDPYTGKVVQFVRGETTSDDVQIDHVVALSNAWQTGAQALSSVEREEFANDPLELLAVDGAANQQKSDADAATWLPPNKPFRCQYVARQIATKAKYSLWVTSSEKEAMRRVLSSCPGQRLPAP